jgi:hypothetical protein
MPGAQGMLLWTQVHARQFPQVFRQKTPVPALGREVEESSMQCTSSGLDHFSIIVVADAEADRHLKIHLCALDFKCDANVRISTAAAARFDTCHLDLESAHRLSCAGGRRAQSPDSILAPVQVNR